MSEKQKLLVALESRLFFSLHTHTLFRVYFALGVFTGGSVTALHGWNIYRPELQSDWHDIILFLRPPPPLPPPPKELLPTLVLGRDLRGSTPFS